MKIRGWQVEGFGVLSNYHIADLPDGLVLVHGPNEAGKSTLLSFLRGVLFGFPDRRGNEPLYPPLRGGRHGGALLLEGPDGVYRVDRSGGRRGPLAIVRPDGAEGSENDLQQLLGGADRQLFRSVFAFSLQELASMETLSSDQVRARIFSAGIAGAGRSAREVIEELQKEATSLLSARSGRIRELVKEAQSLSDQIGAAVRRASDYTESVRQEEDAQVEVGRLLTAVMRAEANERRAKTLIDLWPTESKRKEALKSLEGLPEVISFPADPEARLATALGDVRTAGESFADTEQARQRLREQRHGIEVDEHLPPVAATAADLVAECAAHREHLARIADVVAEVRQHDDGIGDVLHGLGPAWDEPRLASLDTSLPATEEVRGWQQRLEKTSREAESAASALASFDRRVARVEAALERIGAEFDGREDQLTEDWVRAVSARLAAAADDITALESESGASELVFNARSVETAAAALAAARQECARLRTIADDATERSRAIVVNGRLASLQEQATEAARHVEVERQRLRDIESQEATVRERREAVERGIRDLGPGWDEGRVVAVASDFVQIQQAREFAARMTDNREHLTGAQRELDHVGKGRSAREKDLQRLQGELNAKEPTSLETLESQNRALRRLRATLAELAGIAGARGVEERARAEAAREEAPVSVNAGWLPWVAGLMAVVLALLATWRLLARDLAGGASLAAAFVVTAALAFGLRSLASRARPATDGASRRQHRLEEIGRRIMDLERRTAQVNRATEEDARSLGLPDLPTLEQVEDRQGQWAGERDARRRRDDLAADAGGLAEELKSWRESELRRKKEHDDAAEQAAKTLREWEAWLGAKGLPAGMTPDATRDLLQQVRSLQERIEARNATAGRLHGERAAWQAWRTSAEGLFAASGDSTATGIAPPSLFERVLSLQRRSTEEAKRTRERTAVEHEADSWLDKLATAQVEMSRLEGNALSVARDAHKGVGDRWRSAQATRGRERGQVETVGQESERATREWNAWQADHGVDRRMSPEGVLDLFGQVRRGHEAIVRRVQAVRTLEALRTAVAGWEQRVADAARGHLKALRTRGSLPYRIWTGAAKRTRLRGRRLPGLMAR